MSRLTKQQAKKHDEAQALVSRGSLSFEERLFVVEHWQESATNVNTTAGAFFTPWGLATDLAVDVGSGWDTVIDLCAGIGTLSLALMEYHQPRRMVCVEINPNYVVVGRQVLPEAEWIEASIFDLPPQVGRFDLAVSNPPFGKIKRPDRARGPRYSGGEFEYHVIDIASQVATYGAFILPQVSCPFEYSGKPHYKRTTSRKVESFEKATGIELDAGCGMDTSVHADDWHLVKVPVEIAHAEFVPVTEAEEPASEALFEMAAPEVSP